MLAVKSMDVRENFKDWCNKAGQKPGAVGTGKNNIFYSGRIDRYGG